VAIVAIRLPDDRAAASPSVRDLVADLGSPLVAPCKVRLTRPDLPTAVLYVRGVAGRFERVSAAGVAVPAGPLQFRAIRPGGGELPPASWEIEVERIDPATGERSRVRREVSTR
jgi:hypothetical protein